MTDIDWLNTKDVEPVNWEIEWKRFLRQYKPHRILYWTWLILTITALYLGLSGEGKNFLFYGICFAIFPFCAKKLILMKEEKFLELFKQGETIPAIVTYSSEDAPKIAGISLGFPHAVYVNLKAKHPDGHIMKLHFRLPNKEYQFEEKELFVPPRTGDKLAVYYDKSHPSICYPVTSQIFKAVGK